MGIARFIVVLTVLSTTALGQVPDDFVTAQKMATAALNFRQGDAAGFNRARENFTDDGWKAFVKHMEGFLDADGSPSFKSEFVATRAVRIVDDKDAFIHLKIPGTLTQSNQFSTTTYRRFVIEVYAVRDATEGKIKIQRLNQITCVGASKACD